jgi:hypothetical protein
MTFWLIFIATFLALLPVMLWIDQQSITQEDLDSIEDWHNFKKAIKGDRK